jgi:hypothetical protein
MNDAFWWFLVVLATAGLIFQVWAYGEMIAGVH